MALSLHTYSLSQGVFMKLLSILLLSAVSLSSVAQVSSSENKKNEYITQKSSDIASAMKNKFDDPEEPRLSYVADFVSESFAKDGFLITTHDAYFCIARELRGEDERYATSYQVLRGGFAVKCFDKYLSIKRK